MNFNKEDTILKTLDEDYDMVPINTYIRAMNNYRMFSGIQQGYPNNFMPKFRKNDMDDATIKPMTYYKIDHNLSNSKPENNYDFRNVDLKDGFGMRMMEEDDVYSDDKTRDLDYDDFVDVNKILIKIERYNPGIFQFLRRYGMSYEEAKKIIKKIITVTLMYEND